MLPRVLVDEFYMRLALELARQAAQAGEVPVGAVVVRRGVVVGVGLNSRECSANALGHAELMAIDAACRRLGGWRLFECELYVTLEPCPMCAGAIINARVLRVAYGARDEKAGVCHSVLPLFDYPFNHRPYLQEGVLREECAGVLSQFFIRLRQGRKKRKWKKPQETSGCCPPVLVKDFEKE